MLFHLADTGASTPSAMTTFLTDIGTFFTKSVAWLGEALSTIVGSPALLVLVIAMPVCGFAVGLLHRLVRM